MNTIERCIEIKKMVVPAYNQRDYALLKTISDNIKEEDDFSYINVSELSLIQMKELGFQLWNDNSQIMLIPLWLFHFVDPELTVRCIDNTDVQFKDADNDHRGGMLAYGVIPKL